MMPNYATRAFRTIAVAGQADVVADGAADTLTLVAGDNVYLTTDPASDRIMIAAAGAEAGGNVDLAAAKAYTDQQLAALRAFAIVAVSGQGQIAADSVADTLTLVAGDNVTLTIDPTTDRIVIAAAGGGTGVDLAAAKAYTDQEIKNLRAAIDLHLLHDATVP
jgi:hypothetical protein